MNIFNISRTLLILTIAAASVQTRADWFDDFKQQATPRELYTFLYAMPKGGDLHNHLSGAGLSKWWYDLAVDESRNGGYRYYTKVKINNCRVFGSNEFGSSPYLVRLRNIQQSTYDRLDDCEKSEYKPLADLEEEEKLAWYNSIRLDKDYEGRQEFFGRHWQRLNELSANPHLIAELLVKNMQAFGREGLLYLETQSGVLGYKKPDGSDFSPEDVADIYRARLTKDDAKETGVTVRLQQSILRFHPKAVEMLDFVYRFVDKNRDLYVGVNMVGREDNDKGFPLRFLPKLRELRRQIPKVALSIHGGEVDEPNAHVRDTLLLGAERIGHGVNLISDPDTMLLMRNGPYLVEINLISNLRLEYVQDYAQHPFPEYLRFGIPVALSTDDRGMWDSNMTDEYLVAVKEFNVSWDELVSMGRNSLQHGFMDADTRQRLLVEYDRRIESFAKRFKRRGVKSLAKVKPVSYSFTCKRYKICLPSGE